MIKTVVQFILLCHLCGEKEMDMEKLSTEQKIIAAAHTLFSRKGYAATRTRDIAEEAGINPALLNYHFGSKEKLFKIIAREKFGMLIGTIVPAFADQNGPVEDKIRLLVNSYTDLLIENEELPLFVLNESSVNKEFFTDMLQDVRKISQPVIEEQLQKEGTTISFPDILVNTISLIIFPFVAKPLLISSGLIEEDNFKDFVINRKDKITGWIMKTIKKQE
jgi:Transcriptional regulator